MSRDPLIPADCDLRGLPWMPIQTERLLDSDLWALSTGEEFKIAFRLWCKAWQQVPAGSLPEDDRILASLAGIERMAYWLKIKPMAMRGFVLCSDRRFYHPVLAEKVLEAWKHRKAQRAKAEKRWGDAKAQPAAPAAGHAVASPAAMPVIGQGQDKTLKDNVGPGPDTPAPKRNGHDHGAAQALRAQAVDLLAFLNEKAKRNYRAEQTNIDFIVARLRDGASVEDCRAVIAKKCREWLGDPNMRQYLRPATLFNRTKFAQYVGELAPAGGTQ